MVLSFPPSKWYTMESNFIISPSISPMQNFNLGAIFGSLKKFKPLAPPFPMFTCTIDYHA